MQKKPRRKKRQPATAVKKAKAKKSATRAPKKSGKPANKIETTPIPNAGKIVTDFEKTLDAAIDADPKPAHGGPRLGAGRKPKPPKPEPFIIDDGIGDAIVEFIKIPFDLWAAKAEIPELSLTGDEAQTAARPTMILLDHYSPNLGEIAIAWASLAVVAAAIMRPRIMILRKYPKKSSPPGQQEGGAGDPPAPAPADNSRGGFPTEKEVKPAKV